MAKIGRIKTLPWEKGRPAGKSGDERKKGKIKNLTGSMGRKRCSMHTTGGFFGLTGKKRNKHDGQLFTKKGPVKDKG